MLTQSELKSLLTYDPKTGVFTRYGKVPCTYRGGYLLLRVKRKLYSAHRLAWLWVHGEFPEVQIDHINGVKDDNRIENLRNVTSRQNAQNAKLSALSTSKCTGVSWKKCAAKWVAYITFDYKITALGRFDSLLDAACARKSEEIRLGFHPNHGGAR